MLLKAAQETFKVLDRDTSASPRSGDAGKVGGVQAEFGHSGSHARRNVTGPRSSRRDRQATDDGLDLGLVGGDVILLAEMKVEGFRGLGDGHGWSRHGGLRFAEAES